METIITNLFAARNIFHLMHLGAKSQTKHLQLAEAYELIEDFLDALAEIYIGETNKELDIVKFDSVEFNVSDYLGTAEKLLTYILSIKGQFGIAIDTRIDDFAVDFSRVIYKLKRLD